jgi:hypothetical protein
MGEPKFGSAIIWQWRIRLKFSRESWIGVKDDFLGLWQQLRCQTESINYIYRSQVCD